MEQQRIDRQASEHLRNIIRIVTVTGLRVCRELIPTERDWVIWVDPEHAVAWIPESKTPNGIAEPQLMMVSHQV